MYEITAKRNVMILGVGTMLSGETRIVEKENEHMKKAKRVGLIDYVEVAPKTTTKPTLPPATVHVPAWGKPPVGLVTAEETKMRKLAVELGIKEASIASMDELKTLIQLKVDKKAMPPKVPEKVS